MLKYNFQHPCGLEVTGGAPFLHARLDRRSSIRTSGGRHCLANITMVKQQCCPSRGIAKSADSSQTFRSFRFVPKVFFLVDHPVVEKKQPPPPPLLASTPQWSNILSDQSLLKHFPSGGERGASSAVSHHHVPEGLISYRNSSC